VLKRILLALLVLSSAPAYAERNDILVGLGIGLGPSDADFSSTGADITVYERPVFMMSFKLGGMFSPQHALYYQYRLGFFRFDRSDWEDGGRGVSSFSGLGYTYFLNPTVGSPYVEAAMGMSRIALSQEFGEGDAEGFGFLVGAGNEFSENLHMGAVLEVSDTINRFSREGLLLKTFAFQLEYKF